MIAKLALFSYHNSQEDQTEPNIYRSKTFKDAERASDTPRKECLAVVWAVILLELYLGSVEFKVRTDHDALHWIYNVVVVSGELARWRLRSKQFKLLLLNQEKIKQRATGALLRLPTDGEDKTYFKDAIPVFKIVRAEKAKATKEIDENHGILIQLLNVIAPGLPALPKIAMTPTSFPEPTTVKLLAEQPKGPLGRQHASLVGNYWCNYS